MRYSASNNGVSAGLQGHLN